MRIQPVTGLAEIGEGDRLGELIAGLAPLQGDQILVISQKVVSKAEGRLRDLREVEPGAEAIELAARVDRDPRLVELILAESARVVRAERDVLITETHSGWVCANAGIDASNIGAEETVALLPGDADDSARRIRSEIEAVCGARPAVIVADSFGRPWRLGQADVAIGCAGIEPLRDWRGRTDANGRELEATVIAVADQLAAAADLCREKDSGVPAAVISGLPHLVEKADGRGAGVIQRPAGDDLFK